MSKPQTQAQVLAQELMSLKPNITTQDKKDCGVKMNVHVNTIQNYLNGVGRDADTAVKMIKFYKARIEKRNEVLA